MPHEQNPQDKKPPLNGIRAMGESDRSPEYKGARDAFVDGVNAFLTGVKELQDGGGVIEVPGGVSFPVEERARITQTMLGPSRRGLRSVITEKSAGISLSGDGVFSPLSFQAVLPSTEEGALVVEIAGTDPMLPRDDEGRFTRKSRSDGDFARLSITRQVRGEDAVHDMQETFLVSGDGSVQAPDINGGDSPTPYNQRMVRGMELGLAVLDRLSSETFIPHPGRGA